MSSLDTYLLTHIHISTSLIIPCPSKGLTLPAVYFKKNKNNKTTCWLSFKTPIWEEARITLKNSHRILSQLHCKEAEVVVLTIERILATLRPAVANKNNSSSRNIHISSTQKYSSISLLPPNTNSIPIDLNLPIPSVSPSHPVNNSPKKCPQRNRMSIAQPPQVRNFPSLLCRIRPPLLAT